MYKAIPRSGEGRGYGGKGGRRGRRGKRSEGRKKGGGGRGIPTNVLPYLQFMTLYVVLH